MVLGGLGPHGMPKRLTFSLTARQGDGPYIPCIPAILLTRDLANGALGEIGATQCVDLIRLDEYLRALEPFDISWEEQTVTRGAQRDASNPS